IPVVYHAHAPFRDFAGSFRFSTALAPAVRWYTKRLYRQADLLLPVSESTDRLLREEGITVDTQVVTNGIDPDRLDGFEQFTD
ncbi:MAG: glycosyltransferase, partial [Candidatus Nanohaloarchaea archaeon]